MKPPSSPMRDAGLVYSIIATRPGMSLPERALLSGLWSHELASITRSLYDQKIIEHRDGRLYPRTQTQARAAPAVTLGALDFVAREVTDDVDFLRRDSILRTGPVHAASAAGDLSRDFGGNGEPGKTASRSYAVAA